MRKIMLRFCAILMVISVSGCSPTKQTKDVKIGVSMGVGEAARWVQEKQFMEARAKELGIQLEVRLNKTDQPLTQNEDCIEMIDDGIDVLILTPRDVNNVEDIIEYAKRKNVKVISYARIVLGQSVDLFVGYDSGKMGQIMGQYLTEMVYQGDYIILRGDENDNNATLLYEGAMRYIEPHAEDIHIILDEAVPNWSADVAKQMVKDAITANGNRVDAILAPNDKLAGACVEALQELGIEQQVVITGMDAELDAAKRIVAGTQDMTIYMDLKELATSAVNEAYAMAMGEQIEVNAKFDNQSDQPVDAQLISGRLVTKQNLDAILIDSGTLQKSDVYGE